MDSFYHGWGSCNHGIQSVIGQVHFIKANNVINRNEMSPFFYR